MTTYFLYTDGATRPTNPGPAGYGWALYDETGFLLEKGLGYLGQDVSNNQAEYTGLIAGLTGVLAFLSGEDSLAGLRLTVRSDSLLLVNQVRGEWTVRSCSLGHLRAKVMELVNTVTTLDGAVTFEHVRGHAGERGNELADQLAGTAVDQQEPTDPSLTRLVRKSSRPATEGPKGHEKLRELVAKEASGKVFPVSPLPLAQRSPLYRLEDDAVANLLLHFPSAGLVSRGQTYLLTLSTLFRGPEDGRPGDRLVNVEALRVAQVLDSLGFPTAVVHRPHAGGHWLSFKELGWSNSNVPTPAVALRASKVEVTEEVQLEGWPACAAVTGAWRSLWEL